MNVINQCSQAHASFSNYLDGDMTGFAMQAMEAHLQRCSACHSEFEKWHTAQAAMNALGPAKPPTDLALRLRVALSNEQSRTLRQRAARLQVRWKNTIAPFLLQASAGLASAILLVGTLALLVSTFAAPEPLSAKDEPLGMASNPRFLYSTFEGDRAMMAGRSGRLIVVEAYVNGQGKVYDYRIVEGPNDFDTRAAIENLLVFSVFEPARAFGQPVRGRAILSFSGISVQG